MRFITALTNVSPHIETPSSQSNSDEGHIYDHTLYDKYMLLTKMWDEDEKLRSLMPRITVFSHPFEIISSTVTSSFIPDCKPMKITNAFMKMWEFLEFITDELKIFKPTKELKMFDVAGAPGMFIIATEQFLQKRFPDVKLNWHTCSLEGGTALTDQYTLFKNNPERYQSCDVTKEEDIKSCLKKGKFPLVTGDIGIFHDNTWNKLQEEYQLSIQWGQMILALNLCEKDGLMFLKMYSFATYENVYLLDVLTKYFDKVYICKPYTSRILNSESYIICIGRNDKKIDEPLTRPLIKTPYESPNLPIVKSFEYNRLDSKYKILSLLRRILQKYPKTTLKQMRQNYHYKVYFDEFKNIFNEMLNVGPRAG